MKWALLSPLAALLLATTVRGAGPFGLALSPPMGWRSWNAYGADVSQAKLTAGMDAMATKKRLLLAAAAGGGAAEASLVDLGYVHFGLDDAWQACGTGVNISGKASYYSAEGEPLINTTKFPDMRAMVAHGTGTGLRVGWYLNNCICSIYDYGPELEERIYRGSVAAVTKYNFSAVKLDSCGGLHNTTKWAELLAATGREVLVENCNNDCIPGGVDPDWPKGHCSAPCKAAVDDPVGGICPYDFFRISNDIFPFWDSVMNNLLRLVRPKPIGMAAPAASGGWLTEISRPGRWAYPDMLQVGNLASFAEDRSHFGAWCIVSSPLILGYDLTNETTARRVWPIISNVEAISINQQWAGHPGALVHNWSCPAAPQVSPLGAGCLQLWAKPLPGGKTAVLLLNTKSSPDNATVELAWLGLKRTAGAVTVRDVWQRRDLAPTRSDTGVLHVTGLASHDSRLWVLGAAPATSRNPEEVVRASLKADDDDDVHTSSPSTTGRPKRSISWWWDCAHGGTAEGLIEFCKAHTNIVTRVMMICEVFTCISAGWSNASAPRGTCTNNNGVGGTVTGTLSEKCKQAIPALNKLGIETELWLGEDDSISSARYQFSHAKEMAASLLQIAAETPGITGFNLDLETDARFTDVDRRDYARFLTDMTDALHAAPHGPLRFSADLECHNPASNTIMSNCSAVAGSGVASIYTMYTYNSADYYEWSSAQLAPALATVPLDTLGVGLGCWVDPSLNGTWNLTPESADDRVCKLMNESVQEIGMFSIRQGFPQQRSFPEPFWIAPLERFMRGESCPAKVVTPTKCPAGRVGPPLPPGNAWHQGGYVSDWGCCTSSANRGAGHECNASCAKGECAAAGMHWRDLNNSIHPFTCCLNETTVADRFR